MNDSPAALWAPVIKPSPAPTVRLICFPYAGASAWMYRPWRDAFADGVEVRAVQLPGRGPRLHESRIESLDAAAAAVSAAILPLSDRPLALFGHSFGALLAFECARRLQAADACPVQLFVSAEDAPHVPDRNPPLHHLERDEFLRELRALNGMPQAILDCPDLLEILLPVVRSDFTALETYTFRAGPALNCPITVFGGLHDPRTSIDGLARWGEVSAVGSTLERIVGDHFFVDSARPQVVAHVAATLTRSVSRAVA